MVSLILPFSALFSDADILVSTTKYFTRRVLFSVIFFFYFSYNFFSFSTVTQKVFSFFFLLFLFFYYHKLIYSLILIKYLLEDWARVGRWRGSSAERDKAIMFTHLPFTVDTYLFIIFFIFCFFFPFFHMICLCI